MLVSQKTSIYFSLLILCSTICVHSATRHNIYFSVELSLREISYVMLISFPDLLWTKPKARSGKVRKFVFSWLAAPFDSYPFSSLKIDAVFRGKLSSNASSKLGISAVGKNEKPIGKDERRKDLEVICHSGLNKFCNMIVPLPKSQTRHPARAKASLHLPHMVSLTQNFINPHPCSHFFALTRSPNLCTKTACRELIPEAF